ncbi:MAG: hypothetical protein IT289_05115 [Oligoflexia bacterium]|nr:hypothetical protein [Oligoflexia bacterium]
MTCLIPVLKKESHKDLGIADTILSLETDMALKCRLGIYAIQWTFHKSENKEKLFRTNPMNTFQARLLESALKKAAMDTYSQASEFVKEAGLKRENIVGLDTLRNHRHYHSHTYVGSFNDKQVREFIESDKHYRDDVALRTWQVRSSVIQIMIKNKIEVKNPLRINPNPELAELVYNVFRASCKDMGTLTPEVVGSTLTMFSMVLMAKYAEVFQEEFLKTYSEGPLLF